MKPTIIKNRFSSFIQARTTLPVLVTLCLILLLLLLPTGYEDAVIYQGTDRCQALVLEVNNDSIKDTGLVRTGEQTCTLQLLGGKFKDQMVTGVNLLNGSYENDKIFQQGDKAMVVIDYLDHEILSVNMIDHYRMNYEFILALIFVVLLILVAGPTGIRAVLSFVLTILALWKLLIPLYLNGYPPIWIGLLITCFLTIFIISLVFGFDVRSLSAILGSLLGILVTCLLGSLFTNMFKIHGAIMPYSESLLYNGYRHLSLTKIFMASIFISSSGAIMDLSVDITSAVYEVIQKKPEITWKEACRSGMNVGRAAMGTMTTTLLLAYSGGYVSLLMVFMAQGTPISNLLNYKYVSAEIIDTIVGSFGLVTVAPFTALTSGRLLTKKREH